MLSKEYQVKLFTPGKKIIYNGQLYTVDHVRIQKGTLLVKFAELATEVNSEEIDCEFTTFVLK